MLINTLLFICFLSRCHCLDLNICVPSQKRLRAPEVLSLSQFVLFLFLQSWQMSRRPGSPPRGPLPRRSTRPSKVSSEGWLTLKRDAPGMSELESTFWPFQHLAQGQCENVPSGWHLAHLQRCWCGSPCKNKMGNKNRTSIDLGFYRFLQGWLLGNCWSLTCLNMRTFSLSFPDWWEERERSLRRWSVEINKKK